MKQNMKRLTAILVALIMMLALAACSGSKDAEEATAAASDSAIAETNAADNAKTGSKMLVAFFNTRKNTTVDAAADSLSSSTQTTVGNTAYGNAQLLAKYAVDATGADVFSIETVAAYDEDHNGAIEDAQEEQNQDARPELKTKVTNMEDYDTVVLIYPCWWGDMPMAVWTFLESYDFSGKTICPISTHGGSGMGSSVNTIKKLAPKATVKDGLDVSGNSVAGAEADVQAYLK